MFLHLQGCDSHYNNISYILAWSHKNQHFNKIFPDIFLTYIKWSNSNLSTFQIFFYPEGTPNKTTSNSQS